MTRKTKQDWFIEGLHLLAESGGSSLKIETLTTRLGVTKGSFYHHFQNFADFKSSLLTFIEEEGTLQIIRLTEEADTTEAKINRLLQTTTSYEPDVEIALRAWAGQDEEVRAFQERIDGRRLAYVQKLSFELTGDEDQAQMIARLLYAIYVGSQQMLPPLAGADVMQLYELCKAFLHVP